MAWRCHWPDRDGWNQPSQYRTIQSADLNGDGKAELLARAADGVHVYRWDPATTAFTDISKPPRLLSNAAGGNQPSVYETIQTADLFGDGHAELVARTPQGIEYARWRQDTGQFVDVTRTGIAPDAHGGNNPSLYKTIQTGDLSGDGRADLLLLAGGLRWYAIQPDGDYAEEPPMLPGLDHEHGCGRPSQYETVHAVRIAGHEQELVLARAADGLHVYQLLDSKWSEVAPVLGDLSDSHGFDQPSRYRTILAGDVTGRGELDVVARTAEGIAVWERRDGSWARLPASGPALTGPVWEDPSHYDKIRLGEVTGDGRAALLARGVFGVRTFIWHHGAFGRPQPYGHFPGFAGSEAGAYAEVARLLLGRADDFRRLTYASPHEAITEATLNDYRARLAERCTPLAAKRAVGAPPRYSDCAPPPGSDVEPAAWTAVSNQIIGKLWAASGVVAHFTILDAIETKLFQDKQGALPALDRELTLPPDPPDRSPTYLKLTKASLDILKGVVEFFPVAGKIPHILRTVALTGNVLGAVADGLGLRGSPAPPASYGQIAAEVATLQQRERDITQAQRRYVLADYGLLSVVGAEVKARVLTLDETAALSAGREAFAMWVTQLYLPAYWARYQVTGCARASDTRPNPIIVYVCDVPSGAYAQVTGHNGVFRDFHAVLVGGSNCFRADGHEANFRYCIYWGSPEGATFTRIVTPIPPDCRYDPTPGSTAAWRYGCSYGVPVADLIDGTSGWNLPLVRCAAKEAHCYAVSRVHSATRPTRTAKAGRPGVVVQSGAITRRPRLNHRRATHAGVLTDNPVHEILG